MAWLPKASTGSVNGGGHPIDDNNIEREYDGCGGGGKRNDAFSRLPLISVQVYGSMHL